ncbi:TIR domain-containing protein [Novosphingobium jiangmenense]|uniref:TIR domain-containing protein n=1 Tax=Novosphingobium jiangmenense TaxID=2791981 RepID=A0ABS0HCA9_9SPHN|nr:TIR domain-containing protein [Novosphingobium jiangmenense]
MGDRVEETATVFVSYARNDQTTASALIEALEAQGYRVWWDGLLEGGQSYLPTIAKALEEASAVIVLWSQSAIASDWVRDEATVGRDRKRLVPLTIDGTEPPLGFRQLQLIDLSRWKGKVDAPGFQSLLRALSAITGQAGTPVARPSRRKAGISRRTALGAGAAVVVGGGLAAWAGGLIGGGAGANSVAVLPFRNLSGDPEQDVFAEGLSEELRSTLGLNPQLEVSAQASSSSVGSAPGANPVEIASRLNVASILQGSFRRAGEQIRVTAQLVDGKTGFEKWSQVFDRTQADLLGVQRDIATTVADALVSAISRDEDWHSERPGGTRNAEAFSSYLKGQSLYQSASGEESDRAALAAFERALALDPAYGLAMAAQARTLIVIANSYLSGPALADFRNASIAAARRATELAPAMPEGHAALGFVLAAQLQMANAREPFQRAAELGFGLAGILSAAAEFAANMGDFEAARRMTERSKRLDPVNPSVFRGAAIMEFAAGNYAKATDLAHYTLSLNPKAGNAHRLLGDIALLKGDNATALAEFRLETAKLSRLRGLAIAERAVSGQAAGDARMAELLREYGDNALYQQAQILAQWGRVAPALDAMEKALALRDSGLMLARNDPMLNPLRKEPRFAAVLSSVGFSTG